MRTKKSTLVKMTLLVCLGHLAPVYGTTYTWTATTPGSDLNVGTNWTPVGPPAAGDIANFNSSLPGIDLNPVATATFTTGEMNFLQNASPFTFTFTNTNLDFTGLSMLGITGTSRDPSINITNKNDTYAGQLQFVASEVSDSFGSAQIKVSSSIDSTSASNNYQVISFGEYALFDSGASLSVENSSTASTSSNSITTQSQAFFQGQVEALDNLTLTIKNSGSVGVNTIDNSIGIIGQGQFQGLSFRAHDDLNLTVSNTGQAGTNSQTYQCGAVGENIYFNTLFSFGNNGNITVSNSGTNSGGAVSAGNSVGNVGGSQFFSGPFISQDGLVLSISNYGLNNANASGSNRIALLDEDQMAVYSFTTGDNSSLSFTNTGINNSTNASDCSIGIVSDQAQFFVEQGPFLAGDNLKLVVTNSGSDGSNGSGSNSAGVVPNQVSIDSTFTTGDNAQIQISNSGTANGSTGGSQTIGVVNEVQWSSGSFIAGDGLKLSFSNFGQNNDPGGSNAVGQLVQGQYGIGNGSVGNNATLTFTNTGINTQGSSNTVAAMQYEQFFCAGDFSAKDNFIFTATNSGSDSSSGTMMNNVANLKTQLYADEDFSVFDNATILLTNSASVTGSTSTSTIGSFNNYYSQMYVNGTFSAHDDLNLTLSNIANNTGSGGNNSLAYSYGLAYFNGNFVANDRANISITNAGTLTNNGSSNNLTVSENEVALATFNSFTAGDDLTLTVINSGTNTSTGSNSIVSEIANMLSFNGAVSIGKNGTINVTNSGSYNGTDISTSVAYAGDQFYCNAPFSAGENFSLIATNTSDNPTLYVGHLENQIAFEEDAVFNDGTLIKAVNSGTITSDQIYFGGHFNVLGKATFEAINTGVVNGFGIFVVNSAGGDINVILQNSSLAVFAPNPFMLGALNGDMASTASSMNGLIINTDSGVNAAFAGTLTSGFIVKDGLGTQTLSGAVTSSSLSLVNEGVLNLTDTFSGDILIRDPGILTGSATITGTLYNAGTVFPNKTLTVTNFYNSGSGTLQADVSAQSGNSLLAVTNDTTLNGGDLLIGSLDGTYLFYNPYTVVTSGTLSGTFDRVTAVSPLINPQVTYLSDSVQVLLKQNISAAAFNHNQRGVASVLDGTTNPTLAQSLLLSQLVDLSIPEASAVLESLSGEQYANETFYNETINRQFIRRLYDPLRFIVACPPCYDPCGQNLTTWFEVGGNFTQLNHWNNMNGFQLTGGAHLWLNQNLLLGAAVSYEGDWVHYDHHRGSQTKNTGLGGFYGLFRQNCFYVLGDLAFGYTEGHLKRKIQVNPSTANGYLDHSQLTFYGESGVDLVLWNVAIEPFVGVEVNSYWRNSLRESDAGGFGLLVHQRNRTATYTRLGLHLTACNVFPFRASFDAAWDYRCTRLDNRSGNELLAFAGSFDTVGEVVARNSFDYALTVEKDINQNWSAYIETTGQIYNRASTYTVLGGVSVNW